jgi:hypothetical protein
MNRLRLRPWAIATPLLDIALLGLALLGLALLGLALLGLAAPLPAALAADRTVVVEFFSNHR